MFRKAKTFVQNHWKKMVFGGIAVQVASYGLRYATNRFIAYQEDQARLYWKKIKKQQHFESLEENCMTTYRQLAMIMKGTIQNTLDAETLLDRLKNNEVENKLEAWEELKVLAFSRILATVYGTSLLYVLVRIQLSVIGGYLYSENSNGRQSQLTNIDGALLSNVTKIDGDIQRKYLTLAEDMASSRVQKICEYILQKVRRVVGQMSLKQIVSASDIEQMFWAIIRKEVTPEDTDSSSEYENLGNPSKFSWKYIFPNELLEDHEFFQNSQTSVSGAPDMYKKLICETYDLLESDDVKGVLRFFESHGVSHFVDRVSESIRESSTEVSFEEQSGFNEPKLVVAKLVPLMNSLNFIDILDDPWIHLLMNSESVRVLSANIYESFSSESM